VYGHGPGPGGPPGVSEVSKEGAGKGPCRAASRGPKGAVVRPGLWACMGGMEGESTDKMIQLRSKLRVVDNRGVRRIRCIQVQGGRRPRARGGVGDRIRASVVRARPHAKLKKGDLVQAVVVRVVKESRDVTGIRSGSEENAAVVVTREGAPRGSRRMGPLYRQRRRKGHGKLVSLAKRRA